MVQGICLIHGQVRTIHLIEGKSCRRIHVVRGKTNESASNIQPRSLVGRNLEKYVEEL